MPNKFHGTFIFAFGLLLLEPTRIIAQTGSLLPAHDALGDRNQGLVVHVSQPVTAKPKLLRIVLQCKAEEATEEKAIERLSLHMKLIREVLVELGAIERSVIFSEIETAPSNILSEMMGRMNPPEEAWMEVNAQAFFPAQPAAQANFQPAPMVVVGRSATSALPNDPSKTLPAILSATSAVAADWSLDGKSNIEIAMLKPKLLAAIAARNLNGMELFRKFTPEQEDEIFEITKIDIRNGDTPSLLRGPLPAPKTHFIGYVPEQDYNESLKSVFQTADKLAKQIATAGNLKLGKMDSVSVQMTSRSQAARSNAVAPMVDFPYPIDQIPYVSPKFDWEPEIPTGEIRLDSLNQLQQNLTLTARFKIE